MDNQTIKEETIRLYDSLPQELEARKARSDVRDKVIELNYTFFGFVASHTYVNNSYISYEDKFQSALVHFLEIWWQYRWKGDATHRGYRQDLSFGTFFKPRLSEMIDRELTEVKYSIYRPLKMKVGAFIGKHWSKVTYEDLSDPRVKITPEEMNSLKAIFGAVYTEDIENVENFIPGETGHYTSPIDMLTDNYNTIEELLVHEMIDRECKLEDSILNEIHKIYGLDIDVLKEKLPAAEKMLYKMCHDALDARLDDD